MKTILITGSSTGIGRDTCKFFQQKGWNVAATMRKPENEEELNTLDNVKLIKLDVTDKESVKDAIKTCIDHFGGLDVVVNNAGYGLAGPLELASEEQIIRQYETNVYGPIRVMKAVIPHFREKRSGVFINISSVGGRITLPLFSFYHGTKFALEGISESLNFELGQFGIKVKIVEPGGVKTDFGSRSLDTVGDKSVPEYNTLFEKVSAAFGDPKNQKNYSTGTDIAEVIFRAATDDTNKIRYPAGKDAKIFFRMRALLGDSRFVGMLKKRFKI